MKQLLLDVSFRRFKIDFHKEVIVASNPEEAETFKKIIAKVSGRYNAFANN